MTQVFAFSSRQVLALTAVTVVTAVGVVLAFNVSTVFAAGFGNNNNHNHDNHHDNNHGGQCTYNDNHNFHYHHHNGGGDNTGSTTPDSLTIEKDTVGGDGTFSFDISGGDSFSQNVQITTTGGVGDSSTFSLDDGTYTINEEAADGWTLSDITCQDDNGDVAVTPVGDAGAQIDLSGGDDVTCAFTNTANTSDSSNGQITLVKNTVGGDGVFPFSVTGPDSFSDSPSITTASGTGTMSETGLEAGTYNVSENVPSGWTLTGESCQFDAGSTGSSTTNGETITLGSGGSVTCTFTDTMASSTATSTGGDNGGSGGNGGSGAPQSNVVFGAGGGNPGVSGGGSTGSTGQVLGAETGPTSCVPPLTGYLRFGWKNDPTQVKALQAFLNQNMGTQLPLSGIYDVATEDVVNGFQLKYFMDVLAPWVKYGLPTDHTPTGYVYKLTEWKVNSLACPANNIPEPQIP
jgi:hypothetical protein